MARIHPLTGQSLNGSRQRNGTPREEVLAALYMQRRAQSQANMSYDAARLGTDLDGHWVHADAYDADSANRREVRHRLMRNSRYERGSNGIYSGIIRNHSTLVVGETGPTLRMLTENRTFNQLVEREFFAFAERIDLRMKLECMSQARVCDGEAFGVLVQNDALPGVQIDLVLVEAEQVQTPFIPTNERGYIDGIRFDPATGEILWYDVLRTHPGSSWANYLEKPMQMNPRSVLHWFRMERPGQHRGIPELTPTLPLGAMNRRMREATVSSVESAASIGWLLKTQSTALTDAPDEARPFTSYDIPARRAVMHLPEGWEGQQMDAKHPNAQYEAFCRQQASEMGSPLAQPYNLVSHDSSTYSFASGKLDTLAYRAVINADRQNCNRQCLDKLFAAWFREWTIIEDRRDIPPVHQWDWPVHPVIDEVAHTSAIQTELQTGTKTLRQVFSDQGQDLEDQKAIMAEDWFGEASEENIAKVGKILVLKNTPSHAMQAVSQLLDLQIPAADPNAALAAQVQEGLRRMESRIHSLESQRP